MISFEEVLKQFMAGQMQLFSSKILYACKTLFFRCFSPERRESNIF